jgi:hypothetical protein
MVAHRLVTVHGSRPVEAAPVQAPLVAKGWRGWVAPRVRARARGEWRARALLPLKNASVLGAAGDRADPLR